MNLLYTLKFNVKTAFFYFLTFLGVFFYISWGVLYGGWFDIGVYSITAVLVGFGLVGMFLYSNLEEEE